jgi:hypothetical protein
MRRPGQRTAAREVPVQVEASILIDAPRDEIFALLTEYGSPARLRINPELKVQTIVERGDHVVVCDNEWQRDGEVIRQRRRYALYPPDRIEEAVVGATRGMLRVVTTLEPEGEQTRLTMVSEYEFGGIWRFLGRIIADKLRESDEKLLDTLKAGIEAEFVEVEVDGESDAESPAADAGNSPSEGAGSSPSGAG